MCVIINVQPEILAEQNIGGFAQKQGKLKVYGVNFDGLFDGYDVWKHFGHDQLKSGQHVYKNVWTPTLGDELECREGDNDFGCCCCWTSTSTSANLYACYETAGPSC